MAKATRKQPARSKAKPKPKKPVKPKARKAATTTTRPQSAPVEHVRDLALEAAIIDAPDDPMPRLVYGDWIQARGQRRGEWVALGLAVEAEPNSARLRAAAVAFLDEHRRELLGAGASLLPGAWIGWRGGFIDELRLQPFHGQKSMSTQIAALLAHPSCRFVRHLALGDLPDLQAVIDAIAEQAPPLLETLVVLDTPSFNSEVRLSIDRIARFPSLRRLGLKHVAACEVTMPGVVELYVALPCEEGFWFVEQCPALEELVLDCSRSVIDPGELGALVAAFPKLRRLRVLNGADTDTMVAAIAPHAEHLELVDLSHSQLSDSGAERVLDWPRMTELVALRTAITGAMELRLRERLARVAVSRPAGPRIELVHDDKDGCAWLSHRVLADGRDALRAFPGAGYTLYSLGTNRSLAGKEAEAVPLLEAALSLPAPGLETWAWGNAAIAHERLMHFDEAELLAREGLLRRPREPNFFAILLDALRRSNRLAGALAELPRARDALEHADKARHSEGGARACLLDCLFTLAQGERHKEVVAFADTYASLMKPESYAVIAMSQVALGKLAEAEATMKQARGGKHPVLHHAGAVLALRARRRSAKQSLAALAKLKAANYPEWHWIAVDPNLAALRDEPKFVELIA